MTITLSEKEARRAEMRQARRERERANRVGTNLKPHLHGVIEDLAAETKVTKQSMVRILLLEAIEARGVNVDAVFREWKAAQRAGRE
jgi:hypothetical protein